MDSFNVTEKEIEGVRSHEGNHIPYGSVNITGEIENLIKRNKNKNNEKK